MTSFETVTSLLVVTTALLVTLSEAGGVDLTLVEGSQGTAVVAAVVNKIRDRCIFAEDRLFLRRMAYVASHDGTDNDTYRANFHGGIWQITQSQFLQTQNCADAALVTPCQTVLSELAVDWSTSVTWLDLRKPLYSGLAAALYTLLQLSGSDMSGDVTEQSQFWASAFGGSASEFSALAANATDFDCSDQTDLVFILDSSGSVSYPDFVLMKSFAADVVQVMDVGGGAVRIANIVYGSQVKEDFHLDNFTTASQVKDALLSTVKLGEGTWTSGALNQAALTLYDVSKGARPNAKKVVILITDGRSISFTDTRDSAVVLKDKGTTIFPIGVGNYYLAELLAVASDPTCAHVFTLTQFNSILSILTQIQISTCDASLVLTPGGEVSGEIPVTPVEVVTQTLDPGPNSTITATVECGQLDIYMSYTERKPSAVVYDDYYNATDGSPASILTNGSLPPGTPIYLTVMAARSSVPGGCARYEWKIVVDEPNTKVRLVGGGRVSEGRLEVFANGSWGTVCYDSFDSYDAIVGCRMMGYERLVPEADTWVGKTSEEGEGAIWLDELGCHGYEASLFECSHSGVGVHNCQHLQDVWLDCEPSSANASSLTMVRLVNGSRPSEGRLEVMMSNGTWGTVCQDYYDVSDATVVCSMLNFTGYAPAVSVGEYSPGPDLVWGLDFHCTGSESSLFLCSHSGQLRQNCSSQDTVGVDCEAGPLQAASSTDGGSTTPIIAGAVAGAAALALLALGATLLKRHLAKKTAVKVLNIRSKGDRSTSRNRRRDSSSDDDDSPIPGLGGNAPSMRMPADTRLPPLTDRSPRFPALRR